MVFAPHTSMWDFVIGKFIFTVMRINVRFMIRKESFHFPIGTILRLLGGVPVDRQHVKRLPIHIGEKIKHTDKIAILIAPEGTRKYTEVWKKGFYFIAQYAQVPICLSYLDWKSKTGGVKKVLYPCNDYDKDLKIIQDFYRGMKGKHPDQFNL
jgi:1-acyl-sn-glycerol-3-phosphate acyltransferase